jgi:hypothetical protein
VQTRSSDYSKYCKIPKPVNTTALAIAQEHCVKGYSFKALAASTVCTIDSALSRNLHIVLLLLFLPLPEA